MRKFLPWIIVGGLLLIIGFWYISIKNGAVRVNQEVNKEWGNVETSYQRRNDLIGNLVKTVQGSADFEKSTLEAVIKARSEATSVKIDPTNMTPEQLTQFNQAQGNLNSSLSRFITMPSCFLTNIAISVKNSALEGRDSASSIGQNHKLHQ